MGGVFSSRSSNRDKSSTTASPGPGFGGPRWKVDNKLKELGRYLPLYKAALGGKWNDARKFMLNDREALTAKISIASETALHIAVGTGTDLSFVEKLVNNMSPEDLALTDQNGETALSIAAVVGNLEAAKLLVSKNPDLPNIPSKSGSPLHKAAEYGHKLMVEFLWRCTRNNDMDPGPFSGENGAKLLISLIHAEFYVTSLILPDFCNFALQQDYIT